MPTYEYRCKECGHHLEVVQAFSDDPLTDCPACGGQLRKVFGNIGVVFKGSGFYRTDSRTRSMAGGNGTSDTAGDKAGDRAGEKAGDKATEKSSDKAGDKAGAGGDTPAAKPSGAPSSATPAPSSSTSASA